MAALEEGAVNARYFQMKRRMLAGALSLGVLALACVISREVRTARFPAPWPAQPAMDSARRQPRTGPFREARSAVSLAAETITPSPAQPLPMVYPPDVPSGPTASAAGMLPPSSPTRSLDELKLLAGQVTYEANRRLQMLTDRYRLSEQQQALVFPVIARASCSYVPELPIEGEAATDAHLAAQESSERADSPTGTVRPDDPTSAEATASDGAPAGSAIASLDALESDLAPFLNSDQLALIEEEQLDRFYWWGEVLLKISDEIDADDLIAQALSGAPAAMEETPTAAAAEPADATPSAVPAAHQGGNLLDLLYAQ
jgi:hypothetical protein